MTSAPAPPASPAAPATALVKKPKPAIETFRDLLTEHRDQFKRVLPRQMADQVDRMVQVALVAISRNERLLACTPYSVLRSLMVAAQMGLDPSGVLGQGWLVPYRNNRTGKYEAQFIPGYRGLRELARRTGDVLNVEARVVYEKDLFEYVLGYDPANSRPSLRHVPCLDADPGKVRGAYSIVWMRESPHPLMEIMSHAQIEKVRAVSRAANEGPWVDWWEEMARKTVFRRALSYVPLSTEAARSIALADTQEATLPGAEDATALLLPELPPEVPAEALPSGAEGTAGGAAPTTRSAQVAERVRGRIRGRPAEPAAPATQHDAEKTGVDASPAPIAQAPDAGVAPTEFAVRLAEVRTAHPAERTEAAYRECLDAGLVEIGIEGRQIQPFLKRITGKAGRGEYGPEDYELAINVLERVLRGEGLEDAATAARKQQ